ncbi:MAG: penicillin-binding protein 2 [Eubacterium sp.]|jgi:stage V sporulation protein D (sporulation-specific penicillin-binding protein)|nr:penicillin-binding protein 2 [Eubacterium sp.]
MVSDEQLKKNKYRRKKVMLKRVHTKGMVALVMVVVILMALGGQVFRINYTHGETYAKAVLDHQTYTSTELPYKRGQILTGDGTVLAYSERVYNLILDVKLMLSDVEYKEPTLSALCKYFNLNRSELEQKVSENSQSRYQKLLSNLTTDQIADFKNLMADSTEGKNIKGVWFEDSYIRKYPLGTFASDVVGFASATNGGELGIESQYDEELTGTNGTTYSYVDEGLEVTETQKNAVDGNNIVTTLDYNVQSIIEKCILEYNEEKPSKNTAVVVADPSNGEILGMASYPTFNLNDPRKLTGMYTDEEIKDMSDEEYRNHLYSLWTNYCVSESYEPGSTFKPVTVASALEEGVVKDGDTYVCKGFETVADYKLKCHVFSTIGSHGSLTVEQALMNSCNPYMIHLALEMGNSRFAYYQSLFGFGKITGIDLPGETTGIVYGDRMTTIDAACNSFGQTINVNMMQMMAAYCSIINGGMLYQPHIVKRIESANGEVVKEYKANLVRQTITASTSKLLRRYLKNTVEEGTAKKAGVTGYSVAGKTGTAQKGDRKDNKWIISFIGHAPAENPKFAIYVVIDEPYGTTGTSGSSADVLTLTHNILEKLLPYMNVYKDASDEYEDTSSSPDELTVDGIPAGTASSN